jgi:hypothetical protein
MITGAGVVVIGFNALEPVALAFGDWGQLTVPDLFKSSPWPVIGMLTAAAAGALWLISRYEPRRPRALS